MAIKPLVLVYQELRQPTATIVNPTLTGAVIGPHYHIRTYAEHHDAIYAGLYNVVSGNSILELPAAIPGMKPRAQGFKTYFDKARVVLDSGTMATVTKAGELTAASSKDFVALKIKAGDTLKLTSDVALVGVASGTSGQSNITLANLPVDFTVATEIAAGDTLVSGAYTGKVVSILGSVLTMDTPIGTTLTDADVTITRVRLVKDTASKLCYSVKGIATDVNKVAIKNKLLLTTNFPFAASNVSYEITRKVDKVAINTGATLNITTGVVTLTPAIMVSVDGISSRAITEYAIDPTDVDYDKANIYIEYTALNVQYAHIPAKIEKNTDISTLLGVTDSRNPLGQGAIVMYGNAQATIYAIGIESETEAGWLGAIDTVNRNKIYAQALLTDDAGIIGAFKANNVANEVPEKAQYGIAFGNSKLVTTLTIFDGETGTIQEDPTTTKKIILEDNDVDFTSTSMPVYPGDVVTVSGTTHVVDEVLNANRLKVMVSDEFAALGAVTYSISRALTKDQQAETIAATSRAMGNKRCVMTFSNVCEINGQELPGFYLNCVAAGMVVGLPSQAGVTNKGAAIVEKVRNTNWDYFTESQLDVIAAGGTMVFIQDQPDSLPYIRHQLTTDPSLLETGELSVVKNNDYICLFFKGICKPFLGSWNVTNELLNALRVAIDGGIRFQKTNKVPKIGAPLIDATIESLKVSDISPDRVEIFLNTTQPKPLNTIGLHIII